MSWDKYVNIYVTTNNPLDEHFDDISWNINNENSHTNTLFINKTSINTKLQMIYYILV